MIASSRVLQEKVDDLGHVRLVHRVAVIRTASGRSDDIWAKTPSKSCQ